MYVASVYRVCRPITPAKTAAFARDGERQMARSTLLRRSSDRLADRSRLAAMVGGGTMAHVRSAAWDTAYLEARFRQLA